MATMDTETVSKLKTSDEDGYCNSLWIGKGDGEDETCYEIQNGDLELDVVGHVEYREVKENEEEEKDRLIDDKTVLIEDSTFVNIKQRSCQLLIIILIISVIYIGFVMMPYLLNRY